MLEVTCDTKAEAEQHDGGPADADDREVGYHMRLHDHSYHGSTLEEEEK